VTAPAGTGLPPSGPLVRSKVSIELDGSTQMVEGVFPAGSGFVRFGGRETHLDLICADLAAAERLQRAVDAMVERLTRQQAVAAPTLRAVRP
jgi:hypothetical protein